MARNEDGPKYIVMDAKLESDGDLDAFSDLVESMLDDGFTLLGPPTVTPSTADTHPHIYQALVMNVKLLQ